MLTVTELKVFSTDLDRISLYWQTSELFGTQGDEFNEALDYNIFVLRSEAAMGPYDVLNSDSPLRDVYTFVDAQVNLKSQWRQFFYKLQVVHRPTGETWTSEPTASKDAAPDLVAQAIMFEEEVLFKQVIGTACWIFPKRTCGPRCSCWDRVTRRVRRAAHFPCFGTGFLGGFLSPVFRYVQIDPSPRITQANPLVTYQPGDTTGRCQGFPPVNQGDILVESNNIRWRLGAPRSTERLRAIVHYELVLHPIPPGDIEYELPIAVDPLEYHRAEQRNFTNPQSPESEKDFSDLLRGFGVRGTIR